MEHKWIFLKENHVKNCLNKKIKEHISDKITQAQPNAKNC
jgi:hypothetical protein